MHINDTPEPADEIAALLHFSHVFTQHVDDLLMNHLRIGVSQYRVMRAMRLDPRATQLALAEQLQQTEASISRQLKVLRQQGYATVHKRVEDARARSVILTPRGSSVLAAAEQLLARQMPELSGAVDLINSIELPRTPC